MNIVNNTIYTIEFTSWAYGGEALGRLPDGRLAFVPYALPGETAHIRIVEERRSHVRAELVDVLEPSPERVAPRCPHFGECGGCHYQHLSLPAQLSAKTDILRQQLERIGGLSNIPLQPIVPSPRPFCYRNHIEFHLTPQGELGFHRLRSNMVFPVQECFLPEPALNAVWPQLDFEAIPGLERIGLRLGMDDDLQLILESRDPQPPELLIEELELSAVHLSPAGALVLAGSEFIYMEVLDRKFQVSAGSFFQVNTPMAEALVQHVLATLPSCHPLTPAVTLVDAYCGVGLFSAFLADRVGRLIGVEASPSAAEDFALNLDSFENVELYEAAVGEVLPRLDLQADVILLDPPRTGVEPAAMDGLLRLGPPVVVYISCDPATLARDARRLVSGGYRLRQVTPFDLFPQTYHIESVSFWERG